MIVENKNQNGNQEIQEVNLQDKQNKQQAICYPRKDNIDNWIGAFKERYQKKYNEACNAKLLWCIPLIVFCRFTLIDKTTSNVITDTQKIENHIFKKLDDSKAHADLKSNRSATIVQEMRKKAETVNKNKF